MIKSNVIVDLSHHNKDVDFNKVKQDGIKAVIHKATQGLNYVDLTYKIREQLAANLGLYWGAYHFADGSDGEQQAEHFLKYVISDTGKHQAKCPLLALDIEKYTTSIDLENAEKFVTVVYKRTGRWPLVYGSSYLKDLVKEKETILTKCPLWIAQWSEKLVLPYGWNDWTIWQYTDGVHGPEPHEVVGIGPCDRDQFNGTLQQLQEFWYDKPKSEFLKLMADNTTVTFGNDGI